MPADRTRLRFVAYMLLAFAGIFGFWRQEQLSNQIEEGTNERAELVRVEARERAMQICEEGNKLKDVVLRLVNRPSSTANVDLETIEDPQLRDLLAQSREDSRQFRAEAAILLAEQDCESLP